MTRYQTVVRSKDKPDGPWLAVDQFHHAEKRTAVAKAKRCKARRADADYGWRAVQFGEVTVV
mgnify:CR=1 FL=1